MRVTLRAFWTHATAPRAGLLRRPMDYIWHGWITETPSRLCRGLLALIKSHRWNTPPGISSPMVPMISKLPTGTRCKTRQNMTYAFSKSVVTFCVVLSLCSGPAFSAVIYDESINGDLPELASATPMLTLGIGLNTVLGSQFLDTIGPSTSGDFDSFRFLVPTGARLVSIGFTSTITGTVGGPVGSLYIDTFFDRFNNPGYSLIANEKINVLDPANPISGSLVAGLPVDAGTYLLFQGPVCGRRGEARGLELRLDSRGCASAVARLRPAVRRRARSHRRTISVPARGPILKRSPATPR